MQNTVTSTATVPAQSSLQRAAEQYLSTVSKLASALLGGVVLFLLGFNPLPPSFPLLGFAHDHPLFALLLAGFLILAFVAAIAAVQRERLSRRLAQDVGAYTIRFFATTIFSALGGAVIGLVLGLSALPQNIPMLDLLRLHPPLGVAIVLGLLFILIMTPLVGFDKTPHTAPQSPFKNRLLLATLVSAMSALLFVSLLTTVIVHPSWCPVSICPQPIPITNPQGNNDGILEVFPTATPSAFYVLPGDVAQYSWARHNLPEDTGAILLGTSPTTAQAYRVAIGVHSLQRAAQAGLIIEQVELVFDDVAPVPPVLNVWNVGTPNTFSHNPYLISYRGEPVGAHLIAFSLNNPQTSTDLREGESDEIDLLFTSTQAASLHFHVVLDYTVKGGTALRTLALTKHEYSLVFSQPDNWHQYQLGNDGALHPLQP